MAHTHIYIYFLTYPPTYMHSLKPSTPEESGWLELSQCRQELPHLVRGFKCANLEPVVVVVVVVVVVGSK